MSRRLVDLGGVGIPQDPARWDPANYSHHLRAFEDVFLPEAPYIDPVKFAEVQAQFADYVQRMIAYGNNGIVMPGFLEFVNFDKVGDGHAIYPADSEYRARHLALRTAYNQLIDYAHAMGMDVYLNTDMLALTPPLEAYLKAQFGGLDTENPALWQVYGSGLEELAETMPGVSGLMIRIGEAGTIYNLPGWDYYSALAVRSVDSAQAMLKAFPDVAEKKDKSIIFRTWSVGVGEVGDMHTNPASYDKLLAGIDSPNLIVSTKLTGGDFYSDLPLNATLRSGDQQRIIEFQNRLEFEGSMAFPDYIAPLNQQAMQTLRAANPRIDGIWHWNQNGGPQQAGPMSLYPFYGFWLNIDANSYVTSRLGWEPDADIADLTSAWVRRTFGNDPRAVANLTEMLFLSREAALKGLYISPFATQQVNALGLKTTPMMWIFEWDIVDGSNSVLSTLYLASRDQIDAAIAEGFAAVDTVHRMQALLADIDPAQVSQPELLAKLADSLAYEANLFETLAWYRKAFLRYYQWLDTGDPAAGRDWRQAFGQYEAQKTAHLARYEGDRDFPAYNFFCGRHRHGARAAGGGHGLAGPVVAPDHGVAAAGRQRPNRPAHTRLPRQDRPARRLAGIDRAVGTPHLASGARRRLVDRRRAALRPDRALLPDVFVVPLAAICPVDAGDVGRLCGQPVPAELAPDAAAADAVAGGAGCVPAAAHRPVDSRGGCPRARLFLAQLLDERGRADTLRNAERGGDRVDVLCPLCRTARRPGTLRAASAGQSVPGCGRGIPGPGTGAGVGRP